MTDDQENRLMPVESPSMPMEASRSEERSIIRSIDQRIAKAKDPRDIVLWTKVRDEIIRQNERIEDPRHRRRLQSIQLYFKMGFSIVAFATGVLMLVYGFIYLAPLIIGAGLFALAPDFVMAYLTKGKGPSNEQR